MLDILFEILLAILEPFLEGLLELIAGAMLDLLSRLFSGVFEDLEAATPIAATLIYALLGMFAGGCSVLIFPRHLVRPSRIPGVSLLVSPLVAGTALSLVGAFLRSRDKATTRIENFRYAFAFAFGMALVRLLFAH
jgi:hypothetical protein